MFIFPIEHNIFLEKVEIQIASQEAITPSLRKKEKTHKNLS